MNGRTTYQTLALAVAAVLTTSAAQAVEVSAGDWKFTLNGNVNAYYIYSSCDDPTAPAVGGGLACVGTPANNKSSSVSNGLLPAAFVFGASTKQNGLDIGATLGLYPGISTNDGGSPNLQQSGIFHNTGLGSASLDVRQVYFTVKGDFGEVLAGRNIGLFGADAILNDMTLPGVGGGGAVAGPSPANTTLGSIGLGYIYTDWLSQINYSTPDLSGAKFTIGIFDPLEPLEAVGLPAVAVTSTKKAPGFHGKFSYTAGPLYLSASVLAQKQTDASATEYNTHAFDVGGKYAIPGGVEIMGWYYNAKGVGTTALFNLGSDGLGNERDSDGFLAQVTYTFGNSKIGANYGVSKLKLADGEVNPGLLDKNSKWTIGWYQHITTNLQFIAEYTDIKAKNQAGGEDTSKTFNVGGFFGF
jgi:predicted porin